LRKLIQVQEIPGKARDGSEMVVQVADRQQRVLKKFNRVAAVQVSDTTGAE
jgi:hypothetical protein